MSHFNCHFCKQIISKDEMIIEYHSGLPRWSTMDDVLYIFDKINDIRYYIHLRCASKDENRLEWRNISNIKPHWLL